MRSGPHEPSREGSCYCGWVGEKRFALRLFQADATGVPFEAEIVNRDGKIVQVKNEESLFKALRSVFGDFESSCEVGNCGTCKVGLLRARVEHRGSGLSSEEEATAMLSCVSRGVDRIAIGIQ